MDPKLCDKLLGLMNHRDPFSPFLSKHVSFTTDELKLCGVTMSWKSWKIFRINEKLLIALQINYYLKTV